MTKSTRHPADIYAGKKMKEIRTERGLSQTDMGRALGVSFQQIQKYEIASNRISVSRLHDLAAFLKVSPDVFFNGDVDA